MNFFKISIFLFLLNFISAVSPSTAAERMQPIGSFAIDLTEVTIEDFARYADNASIVTKAERDGGGLVYAAGWEQKAGWNWRYPYGRKIGRAHV